MHGWLFQWSVFVGDTSSWCGWPHCRGSLDLVSSWKNGCGGSDPGIFWRYVCTSSIVLLAATLHLYSVFIGIDLYFGRWDTYDHHLTDTGQATIGTDGQPVHIVVSIYCEFIYSYNMKVSLAHSISNILLSVLMWINIVFFTFPW